jgi:hypothetical protein
MPRLTKSEIEYDLLAGKAVVWTDANNKASTLQLDDAKQRRLFAYLLSSNVREPTGLPEAFVTGLAGAFDGQDDPASKIPLSAGAASALGPWRLHSIEAEGFGGLNTWKGSPFTFEVDSESYLLEGPNSSGKSSLIGAILWALTAERPRDQADAAAHEAKPVFTEADKIAGEWPPVACYPSTIAELKSSPAVRVRLIFHDPRGAAAFVERQLSGRSMTQSCSPGLALPFVFIETGLLMPARLALLRLDDGGGRLTDAVQKLTGLDDLIAIGTLTDGLCH